MAEARTSTATAGAGGGWLAHAKINLYLHVTGRRADGFHYLDSLIVFAKLADRIEVEADENLTLVIEGPFAAGLPNDQNNLVLRAAALLAQAAGIRPQARIRLHKTLPVAAGIGGGSADAAASLLALRALWQLSIDDAGLFALAARLGADVPVCLAARPSFISGIGDRITPAPPLPPFALLLVNPGQALSTAAVFESRQNSYSPSRPWQQGITQTVELIQALARRRNDLEAAARRLAPVVGDVIEALNALPQCRLARMSGSGATCFGLFDSLANARAAAEELAAARPDWWVRASGIEGVD